MKQFSKNSKVIIAMSGGIDSSVAAALLKKQGYKCAGVYLQFWTDTKTGKKAAENKCCSRESMERAQKIAAKLGIPVCVLDVSKKFKKEVVNYFIDAHKKAKTPNPCIKCNKFIKFGEVLEWAKSMGADYLATGHYARVIKRKGKYELHAGKDKDKDQSYFLYTLTQDQLKHVLFPVGSYTKKQVRKLAKKFGLKEAAKARESQGICFFPEKEHAPFLKRHLSKSQLRPGSIKTTNGKAIGRHEGLALYTIGQRKGIKIGGEHDPWYVAGLDPRTNTLIVGKNRETFASELTLGNLVFVSGKPKTRLIKVKAKIRHRFPARSAALEMRGAKARLKFTGPERAITSGQSAVFYKGAKVIGGGEID